MYRPYGLLMKKGNKLFKYLFWAEESDFCIIVLTNAMTNSSGIIYHVGSVRIDFIMRKNMNEKLLPQV